MSGFTGEMGDFKKDLAAILLNIDRGIIHLNQDDPVHRAALQQSSDPIDVELAAALETADSANKNFQDGLPQRADTPAKILKTEIPGIEIKVEDPYVGVAGFGSPKYEIDSGGVLNPDLPEIFLERAQKRQKVDAPGKVMFYPIIEGLKTGDAGSCRVLWYLALYDHPRGWVQDVRSLSVLSPIQMSIGGELTIPGQYQGVFKKNNRVIIHGRGDHIAIIPYRHQQELFSGMASVVLPK